MIYIATLIFLIAVVFIFISVPIGIWNSYKLYKYAKRNEQSFFQKNIAFDKPLSSPWIQFWALMRKGEYVQFEDEGLKNKIIKKNKFSKIYLIVFFIALAALICMWVIGGGF